MTNTCKLDALAVPDVVELVVAVVVTGEDGAVVVTVVVVCAVVVVEELVDVVVVAVAEELLVVAEPVACDDELVVGWVVVTEVEVVGVGVGVLVVVVDDGADEVVVTGLEVTVGAETWLAPGTSAAAAGRSSSPIVMPVTGSVIWVADSWIQSLSWATVGSDPNRER